MSAKQDALVVMDHAITDLLKDGRELKEDAKLRSAMLASRLRLDDNPSSALNRAMAAHDIFMQERNRLTTILDAKNSDGLPRLPSTSARRAKLEQKVEEIDQYLATIPTMDNMRAQAKDYYDNGVPNIFRSLPPMKDIIEGGRKSAKEFQERVTPTPPPPTRSMAPPQGTLSPDDTRIPAIQQMDRQALEKFYNENGGAKMKDRGVHDAILARAKELLAIENEKAKDLKKNPQ